MPSLEARFVEILVAIVRAYQDEISGLRQPLMHVRMPGPREGIKHHAWPDDGPAVGRQDLESLEDLGLVRVTVNNRSWSIAPTVEGMTAAARYQREQALLERAEPVDLSWAAARPVLHAVVDLWAESGASPSAMVRGSAVAERLDRDPDDLALVRVAEQLAAGDWLDIEYDGSDGLLVRPTSRGVMATRNWPGGDGEVAAERLLTALDDLVADEPDEQQRGRLARLRDVAMEVGTKTLAEVVSKSVGGAV